ncbi:hypothetical protein [Chitinophaga sp. Cy-1792]|uniref:hypothetical protein n=1 Tax=Chitinophaga sp. Cy-1792 TaxID=2608339 RepID=UPI0014215EAA|nr:hypothetical protein [Chitinophaga sp. Cy-1792]NIG56010.1 hypothetical protein [Chitinophaga sp. Cy-1792]
MKKLLFSALLCCCMHTVFAHALWIETMTTGKKGQAQEVKIFFGEYADNERDSVGNWFSNMRDFSLYLMAPDGSKQQLECTPAGDHFRATFTPATDGAYVLYIDHTVKEIYGESKIHYYAQGVVKVNSSKGLDNLRQHDFVLTEPAVKPAKVNVAQQVALSHKTKKELPNAELTVQSPQGWTKKVKPAAGETFTFTPAWQGRYLLEGTFTENEQGQQEGKPYQRIWHCVTWCKDI